MTKLSFDDEMHVKAVSVTKEFGNNDANPSLLVVNAARVSVGGNSKEFTDKDKGLVKRLITDRHGTPFEHANIGFLVEVPIFVERQWRTHRWSSFNEHSGRYSKIIPKFYIPQVWLTQVGKAMDYKREELQDAEMKKAYMAEAERAWELYEKAIERGIANEEARSILPVGFYTSFYWTANLRSIANFLSLRTDVHAQVEIRQAAWIVEKIFAELYPEIWQAWHDNGRQPLGA